MKRKLILFFIGITLHTFSYSQNVAGTAVNTRDDNPYKKYLRPSLTVLYISKEDERAKRMQKVFETAKIPDKFNDNNLPTRSLQANTITFNFTKDLENTLTQNVSRELIARWFSRNNKGEFSMDLIAERGLYNATDADVMKAQASQRKLDLLRDAGENLIDRSYIVVYDVYNIKKLSETGNTSGLLGEREGYQCEFKTYLYKLDWTDSVAAIFYNTMWVDAGSFDFKKTEMFNMASFPIKFVGQAPVTMNRVTSAQYKDPAINPVKLSDDELFAGLYDEIMLYSGVGLAKLNEDFKVKAPIFTTGPITAKIGLKEGLSVDKRFFAYEMQLDKNGNRKAVRKGVVRAGNKISDNRGVSTGKSEASSFYQVYGKRLYPGMILQENPDWGMGFMLGWGNTLGIGHGLNATIESNVSMWAGKNGKIAPGIKVYLNGNLSATDLTVKIQNVDSTYSVVGGAAVGVSKDLNFMHYFVLTPFVGGGLEFLQNKNINDDPQYDEAKYNTYFAQVGSRFGISILHNVQLVGNFSLNATIMGRPTEKGTGTESVAEEIAKKRGSNSQLMIGIRFQY